MKKSFFAVLALAILATPLVVLGIVSVMRVKPEAHQPIADMPMAEVKPVAPIEEKPVPPTVGTPTPPKSPSTTYMNGYWDGWHGVWLGPIRWTLSDDYRQGHMLGTYDRRHGINNRYPRPQ
jgi:hypothetical protein